MFAPSLNLKTDEDISSIYPPREHSKLDLIIDDDKMLPNKKDEPF